MPLVQWQHPAPAPTKEADAPAGTVLFNTTLPPIGWPNSYHAMIVCRGKARTQPNGSIEFPICDMTLRSIRYPAGVKEGQQQAYGELNPLCYLGSLAGWSDEDTNQLLEQFSRVKLRIDASGKREAYRLSSHGIFPPDPNRPGEFLKEAACSCASFVEYCFENAGTGHDLVDKDKVPLQNAQELWILLMQPQTYDAKTAAPRLAKWGLKGQGPWPVLLPAYQMRAFASTLPLPYAPSATDHPYP